MICYFLPMPKNRWIGFDKAPNSGLEVPANQSIRVRGNLENSGTMESALNISTGGFVLSGSFILSQANTSVSYVAV